MLIFWIILQLLYYLIENTFLSIGRAFLNCSVYMKGRITRFLREYQSATAKNLHSMCVEFFAISLSLRNPCPYRTDVPSRWGSSLARNSLAYDGVSYTNVKHWETFSITDEWKKCALPPYKYLGERNSPWKIKAYHALSVMSHIHQWSAYNGVSVTLFESSHYDWAYKFSVKIVSFDLC